MRIGRSITTAIATHAGITTGVHGAGEDYIAITTQSDGSLSDAEIPDAIARDDEITSALLNHIAEASAHHAQAGLAIYGDGSDGDVTINAPYTGGPITLNALTRDAFFNNLTIEAGVPLNTAGYRIFVKETLTNHGFIHRNGNNGGLNSNGAALAPATLGGSAKGGIAAGSQAGGGGGGGGIVVISAKHIINTDGHIQANGGDGGDAGTTGGVSNGYAGDSIDDSIGGHGGHGGIGVTGATGGTGGFANVPGSHAHSLPTATLQWETEDVVTLFSGGAGGGGGGMANISSGGGGGGGGGALILIYNTLAEGTEEANGGAAGSGGDAEAGYTGSLIKIANV